MISERLEKLLKHLDESPDDAFLLFAVAKEYEKFEKLDKALTYYSHLKTTSPDYIGLYYHLGKFYEMISEDILAVKTYKEGIELAKKQGDFHSLSELNTAHTNINIQMGN